MSPSLSERLLLPARFIRDALEFRTVRGELSKIVDENHIHILHLNNQVSTNRFAYSLGSKAKIVQHVRDAPLSRSLHTSRLSRRANRIIAISDYVGTDAAMAYSREITDVIANPVDKNFTFSSKSRKEWRDAWSVPDDVLLFGQAGRFVDWKGIDTAIEAYTQLCSNSDFQKSTRLVLVGSSADQSEYFERCKRMADQLPSGQVRIEPFSKDAAGLFSAFDVTLHPIRKPEGFGRVIVESMACRSVPLARDLGAIGEIITHQVDGLIFKNTEDLRKTMREIHQSPASLRKLSDRGFETAKSYSAEGIAHKMENIYREVVSA